jgi:hypothetical protein
MLSKTLTTIILSIIVAFSCYCQGHDESPCVAEKGENGTQGKKEDQWSRKLIRKEYSKKNYSIYTGVITVLNDDTIKYNDEILIVTNTCKDLKLIFQKGILYPEIINGQVTVNKGLVTKQELDSQLLVSKADSLEITDFEELAFIKHSPGTKFFHFWLYRKGVVNPSVCFIALYNKTANRKTDLLTFINGSRLTFFTKGWIII